MAITNIILNNAIPTYLETDEDNKSAVIKSEATKMYMNVNSSSTFSGCSNLQMNLDTDLRGLNWSKVEDASYCFVMCGNVTGSPFIGENITNMCGMYQGCEKITGNAVYGPNVVDIAHAYQDCKNITSMDYIPDSVQTAGSAFWGCSNLETVYVGGKNANTTSSFSGCYGQCPNIKDLYISDYMTELSMPMVLAGGHLQFNGNIHGNLNGLTTMNQTFAGMVNAKGEFKCGPNVTNMFGAYLDCHNFSGEGCYIPDKVTDISDAFVNCYNLTKACEGGNNVINMAYAYTGCNNLTGIVNIPANVNNLYNCFENDLKISDICIHYNKSSSPSDILAAYMLKGRTPVSVTTPVNVYVYRDSAYDKAFYQFGTDYMMNVSFPWSTMDNGYYCEQLKTYVYNNFNGTIPEKPNYDDVKLSSFTLPSAARGYSVKNFIIERRA